LLLNEDDYLIKAVYDYWVRKRKNCRGPSLIPQIKQEKRDGSTNNDPYVAFRRRTEKMQTRKVTWQTLLFQICHFKSCSDGNHFDSCPASCRICPLVSTGTDLFVSLNVAILDGPAKFQTCWMMWSMCSPSVPYRQFTACPFFRKLKLKGQYMGAGT